MGRITITAYEQHEEILDRVQAEDDLDSEAAAVRECIERAERLQQELTTREAELMQQIEQREDQISELEQKVERLENEKHTLIQDRQERTELVRYVEEEISYRDAPVWTRAKWWLMGREEE